MTHCWVLKHQGRLSCLCGVFQGLLWGVLGCVVWVGGWVCVSGWSSFVLSLVVGGGGLVGLLFEICIVDASIN